MDAVHACPICQEDMTTRPFCDASPGDTSEGNCFRLACKHAFHTACIVQCFRTAGPGCPVCRDGIDRADSDSEDEESDDGSVEMDAVARAATDVQLSNTVAQLRKVENLPLLRRLRRATEESVKRYNMLRDSLRAKRRAAIASALNDFRRTHYKTFRLAVARVNSLQCDYMANYVREVKRVLPDVQSNLKPDPIHEVLRQNPTLGSSVRHQDPLLPSFWRA